LILLEPHTLHIKEPAQYAANLVQAQRDYFGAHTYERVDMPGSFHNDWFKIARNISRN
jgi:6-phosphogluconate dehydrogenase